MMQKPKKRWLILEEIASTQHTPVRLVCYGRKTGSQINEVTMNYECPYDCGIFVRLFPNRVEYRKHIREMKSVGSKIKHMVYE